MGMMDQYHALREQHPDTVLFFRMGDFYELFGDDASTYGPKLGLTVTTRDRNSDHPMAMAGFPWHALEGQVRKLLAQGHKVTVADQEQELRPGEKILQRVVTRVYTPGSLYEADLLADDAIASLAVIIQRGDHVGVAVLDPSTGGVVASTHVGASRWESALDDMLRGEAVELVVRTQLAQQPEVRWLLEQLDDVALSVHDLPSAACLQALRTALGGVDPGHLDLDEQPMALEAAGLGADYLRSLRLADEVTLRDVVLAEEATTMRLDSTTLRNLEVLHTLSGDRSGGLVSAVDRTQTAMGGRRLRAWLLRPLLDRVAIAERHAAVGALVRAPRRLRDLRAALAPMRDLERLSTRLAYGTADARDLVAIADVLERAAPIEAAWSDHADPLLARTASGLASLATLAARVRSELIDTPPASVREGGMFRDGGHPRLDAHRAEVAKGEQWLAELEAAERLRLGIPSLKVRLHKALGYCIEVTRTHFDKVPEEYVRRQSMAASARYTTDDLQHWESIILEADGAGQQLEHTLFLELRDAVATHVSDLTAIAGRLATLDVLASFAEVARRGDWCRPELSDDPSRFDLVAASHPVLATQPGFVPNDVRFTADRRLVLVTGPNMGGKSTFLRQAALVAILAQAGAYVPAKRARIGLVDRVFTRVGAHDDLRRGRSTFMVEMLEVAHILRRATPRSLILLDEVGRGTSTFDGLSIAWAVVEDLATRVAARTLFATHYHQLVGLEDEIPGVANVHVQVAHDDGDLTFLHTVADGPSDDSYGVHVAALAGLPGQVVERARDLLEFLERQAHGAKAGEAGQPAAREVGQRSLFGYAERAPSAGPTSAPAGDTASAGTEVLDPATVRPELAPAQAAALTRLAETDPDLLTPREALDLLYQLQADLRGRHDLLQE